MTHVLPQVVFVDGIGGRRCFRAALLRHLAVRGHACHYVGYRASKESLATILARLADRLKAIAEDGPYVLIGYSFGGVLARSALADLPELARPRRLVLVASPMRSLQMCRTVSRWPVFRWLTGDCGELLASDARMRGIDVPNVPTTCIYGTKGYAGRFALAGRSANDGMVAVDEIEPRRFDDVVSVHASHPFIAGARAVVDAIELRIGPGGLARELSASS